MKIFLCTIWKDPAMTRGFSTLGKVEHFAWRDHYYARGRGHTQHEMIETAKAFAPDLSFFQIQTAPRDIFTPDAIRMIPGFKIHWTGDAREPLPPIFPHLGGAMNVTCFTNTADIGVMKAMGHRADYLQIGFDELIYKPQGEKLECPEIVFFGNDWGTMFPLSEQRREMVRMLQKRYGQRFAVYGAGFEGAEVVTDPQREAAIYRSCKVAINQNHYVLPRFSSDRLLRAMGSGALVLSNDYPDIRMEHACPTWNSLDELTRKIDAVLEYNDERWGWLAEFTCDHVHRNHTWAARMKDIKRMMNANT